MRLSIVAGCLAATFFGFLFPATPATAQRRPECRTMETDAGKGREIQMVCRDPDGVWRPQQLQQSADALSADFRGRVTYEGNFSGSRVTPGRAPRRLDLRSILNSAMSGRTRTFAGPTTIVVEYEGSTVRATYTADRQRGAFTGTRNGASCRVSTSDGEGVGTFRCNRNEFTGTFENLPGTRETYTSRVETHATGFIDLAQEERGRQIAAERQRRATADAARNQRAAPRQQSAQAAPTPSRPAPTAQRRTLARVPAGQRASYQGLLNRVVADDSTNWSFKVFRRDSVQVTGVDTGSAARNVGVAAVITGTFSYADGGQGTVTARIANGAVQCLEYQDSWFGCQPPREVRQRELPRCERYTNAYGREEIWGIQLGCQ